jgi:two-component sensor histidine kinase
VVQAEIDDIDTGLDAAVPYGLLLVELVSNSLKHGFGGAGLGGSVQVRLSRSASGPSLRVADSGRGLPDGFSLDSPRTLGLQLAVSLARQLGGELRVEPGTGACFVATLPRL